MPSESAIISFRSPVRNGVADKKMMDGPKNRREIMLIMTGLMISVLLSGLDSTIVGTAMPRIIGDLHGMDLYAWPFVAYMLCSTIAIVLFGRISDMHGRKPIFVLGIVVFLAASMLCGLSQTMIQLVVLRGLQGVGGGILVSIAFTILADLFPPRERGKYAGLLGSMWGLASIIGPAVGGFITDHFSWRWVFYINVPVGMAAIALTVATLPRLKPVFEKKSIDYRGAAVLTLALVPLILAFSLAGTTYAWTSARILGMLLFSILMLFLFYVVEKNAAVPIMPLSIYKNSTLNICLAGSFLGSAVLFCGLIYIPLFVQAVTGASATLSGFILTPAMLGLTGASIVTGQLISRTGRYKIWAVIGFLINSLGICMLYRMDASTPPIDTLIYSAVLGAGSGMILPTFSVAVQNVFPREQFGLVTSTLQFFRNMGGTIGAAIFGAIMIRGINTGFEGIDVSRISPHIVAMLRNPRILVNPEALRQVKMSISPESLSDFMQLLGRAKAVVAHSLSSVFLAGAVMAIAALLISFLLTEVPLAGGSRPPRQKS
jgi:EmrB/QacA subfamily drug resistance transporter